MPNFLLNFQSPSSSETTAETTASPSEDFLAQLNIPSDALIAGMTLPMLLGWYSVRAISEGLQSLGQASEEIFRGDRLPVLHFPVEPTTDPQE